MSGARPGTIIAPVPEHSPEATTAGFQKLSSLILDTTGINLPDSKKLLLQSRLRKRLKLRQCADMGAYCDFLRSDTAEARAEKQQLISAITTNVTRFFREAHHFEDLRTRTLPPLIEIAKRGGCVRIWSAGCSTGEEAYSIAFLVMDLLPDAPSHNIRILATDLDSIVIRTALRGIYPNASGELVRQFVQNDPFEQTADTDADHLSVKKSVRSLLDFKQLNLVDNWSFQDRFDIVFCRNVVIYFSQSTGDNLFRNFSRVMKKNSVLYLGHSERINTSLLPMYSGDGISAYRLKDRV